MNRKNVLKGTIIGVINNVVLAVLNFVTRKLFLNYIGLEYLSVTQIINSVLAVLSFTELGISNAILYMLYKPVEQNDKLAIRRILFLYRKFNRYVGLVIIGIGFIILPFLHFFISTEIPYTTVYFIYVLNVLYTSSTYFCTYRTILLSACQQDYIMSTISMMFSVSRLALQCILIIVTKDYYAYLATNIILGVMQNVIIFIDIGNRYPYIKQINKNVQIIEEEKKELLKNIKGMFSVKIAGIVINNTDNIMVSAINTLMVGICSNYTSISLQLKSCMTILHHTLMHSLGIVSVSAEPRKKYDIFTKILLVNTLFTGISTVALGVLWNDFIVWWIGEKYMISKIIYWSLLVNFSFEIIVAPMWMIRDSNGLFVCVKKVLLINAACNIFISIALGKLIGVAGVYFATVISYLTTNFWYDSKIVYEKLFASKKFYQYMFFVVANLVIMYGVVYFYTFLFKDTSISIMMWFVKGIVSVGTYILLFFVLYIKKIMRFINRRTKD